MNNNQIKLMNWKVNYYFNNKKESANLMNLNPSQQKIKNNINKK